MFIGHLTCVGEPEETKLKVMRYSYGLMITQGIFKVVLISQSLEGDLNICPDPIPVWTLQKLLSNKLPLGLVEKSLLVDTTLF